MLLISKTVEKYGYNPLTSEGNTTKRLLFRCDFCGHTEERRLSNYYNQKSIVDLDACNSQTCRKSKREKSWLKKYGVSHYSKTSEYRSKFDKTMLERYGVKHALQNDDFKQKQQNTMMFKYQTNVTKKILFDDILSFCKLKNYEPLFDECQYQTCRDTLSFLCKKHNIIFDSNILNVQRENVNQCPECKKYFQSNAEKEIFLFVENLTQEDVKKNNRTVINRELDIFVPSKNLAIEFNGIYWHCEKFLNKNYHFEKFTKCKDKGITLLQFFEDEWRDKQDICKSMISSKLGLCEEKYSARNLLVVQDLNVDSFLNQNHLQGQTRCKKTFCLVTSDGEIVCCLTLRKPFVKKDKNTIEIARVCSKKNSIVRGGFSRLMKYATRWSMSHGYEYIISYSNCRYSVGQLYQNYGFDFQKHTGLNYFYTDFQDRYNRFKFRAQNGKSEKEIAKENKVYKIFDVGNYLWIYHLGDELNEQPRTC